MSDVTSLLSAIDRRDPKAAEELLPLVYEELRKLAAQKMANEASGQTLQPAALVQEAWLRLVRAEDRGFQNRAHFFAAAAEAMRRILVENARRKQRLKHGGGQRRMDLSQVDVAAASDDETVLAVSEAIDKLASHDSLGAELIRLRFFAGLSNAEAGELLGLPERTAKRTWAYARAWLYEELKKTL
ncbi:MAG TPA: ECF-type sigma factor [Candidatus Baltobacteraceae bacterium]|jgi:RNA polymerase sigma factor (TIGR02999 family)|nr:ECF-type sigma factor [Candidatus Baltobacteraceae bacterium]